MKPRAARGHLLPPSFHTMERKDTSPRLKVKAFGLPDTVAPLIGTKEQLSTKRNGWIDNGRHNLFPEFCRALADNCGPLNSSVEMMAQYIAGHGCIFLDKNGKELDAPLDFWHNRILAHTSEEEFLHMTALDVALMGSFSWLNMPSMATPTEQLRHIDVVRTRMGPKNPEGVIEKFFWSANWEQAGRKVKDYEPAEYPSFEAANRTEAGVIYSKNYKQTRDYYGEPWWLPAIADSEVMARIPIFNRTQLDTGFRPAFHLHMFDNRDKVDLDQIDEDIEAIFTGANGKVYMVTYGPQSEGAPVMNKLERGDHAGELETLSESTEEKIYRAYGIPKILMGIDTKTGMQGQGLAIEQTLTMFQRTVVRPRQSKITAKIRQIMNLNGFNEVWEVKVKELSPFDAATDAVMQRQAYLRSVTVNENRINTGMEALPVNDKRGELLLIEVGGAADNTENTNG